jgi:hypothetical protein
VNNRDAKPVEITKETRKRVFPYGIISLVLAFTYPFFLFFVWIIMLITASSTGSETVKTSFLGIVVFLYAVILASGLFTGIKAIVQKGTNQVLGIVAVSLHLVPLLFLLSSVLS